RAKIEAAIANARAVVGLWDAGRTLTDLVWAHAPAPRPEAERPRTWTDVPTTSPEAVALAKELKSVGFRFLGPTTAYASMQACGLVDDHLAGCPVVAARR
ncbi:MAG: DNA-3-methyladenine glycosylase I, partial [Propioniciclava sp.]|nr:DNA-3-methyladenine glycosylase I [Propioniciclava sp.]